jgi:hypothetical protein
MAKPDKEEIYGALAALDFIRAANQMVAYPVHLEGVRCTVLGRVQLAKSGLPDAYDSVALMVIVNDELAAKMDLTEVRS